MAKMNKEQLNVTVSSDTKKKVDLYGKSDKYSSSSNFVESAILHYIGALDRNTELELEQCKKEYNKLKDECERNSSILLKILTKHPDLVHEANNQSD